MTTTSPSDDLTISELFHALKQRLSGISLSGGRYVALLNPWRILVRMVLTCTTSSNSSGLDLKEVRAMCDGNCWPLINFLRLGDLPTSGSIRCPLASARFEEPILSRWPPPRRSARTNPRGAGFGTRPHHSLTRLPSLARHPHVLPLPLDQIPMYRRGPDPTIPRAIQTCSHQRNRGF